MTAVLATHPSRTFADRQPRAQGAVRLAARRREGRPALATLYQQGSARALFPREASGDLVAVLLNTAGGLTGGDRFSWQAEAGRAAELTLATQAAERIYRAPAGQVARVETQLTVAPRGRIDWLPQETILFDGGALERSLIVDMATDSTLLAVEPLVLGRQAMGEQVLQARLVDRWRIRRAGELVYADTLRLTGAVADTAARHALFGPHRAAATLVYVAPDAADRLARARSALDEVGLEAGASVRNGVLVARLLAPDGRRLRAGLVHLLATLRGALPRVWTI